MTVTTPTPYKSALSDGRATTYVWLILSAITLLSGWLGHPRTGHTFDASLPITIAVLAIGLVKSRFIIRYFMEVRTAPSWLRIATDVWIVVLWGAVLAMYLW